MHSLFSDSIGAHALRFEKHLAPTYGDGAGLRILWAFLIVGIAMHFALRFAFNLAGVHGSGASLGVVIAWAASFVLVHWALVPVPFAAVGLRRFNDWSRRERLYFFQVIPLAVVVFAVLFRAHLQALLDRHGLAGFLLFCILGGLVWGFAQELIYRGWLQTEFTRRFGSVAGLIVANMVFTFGPLHLDYLGGPDGVRWSGLAAVFGIGLFFAIVYARSGNLWIPAVMHGLWPPNMN